MLSSTPSSLGEQVYSIHSLLFQYVISRTIETFYLQVVYYNLLYDILMPPFQVRGPNQAGTLRSGQASIVPIHGKKKPHGLARFCYTLDSRRLSLHADNILEL